MNEDFGFTLHRRGTHPLAGRTVLQVAPALTEASQAVIAIAAALAQAGARPLVAAPAGPGVSELQASGGVWLDFPAQTENPLSVLLLSRRMRRMIAREQVDLVHARSRAAGWISHAAARRTGTPFVTSLVHLSPGQSVLMQRYCAVMAKGDAVIAGSRFAAATMTALYPIAAGRVVVVRPGVNLAPFTPLAIAPARVQALRAAWGVSPDERILLLAAKPSVWKGHKVLIEAMRVLRAAGHDGLKLVLIDVPGGAAGGGAAFDREIALATADLHGRVVRVGSCPDMPAALLAAAVVVVPSIEAEAFGQIAVEAQGVGTPVVVSDLGALPETVLAPPDVEPGRRTGWRVSPSDPAALAKVLGEALALGASSRDALGQRARRHVEDRFAVERMTRETLDVYAGLLDCARPRGQDASISMERGRD